MSDGSGIPKTSEELRRQAVSKTSNTKTEETEPTPEPKTWAQYKAECAAERKAKAKAEYIAQFGSYP